MTVAQRSRFPARATLIYAILATAWILYSDRMLSAIDDAATIVWLSQAKGLAFVAATAVFLYFALQALAVNTATTVDEPARSTKGLPLFCNGCLLTYAFAIGSSVAMLWLQVELDTAIERPMIILLIFPIVVSALLGGIGPGLLATLTGAAGINQLDLAPAGSPADETIHARFEWGMLIVNGILVSVLSEGLHRSRRHAEALGEAAGENAQRLQLAQDAARSGTWEWNLASNENYWSAEIWPLYGLAPNSVKPGYDAWLQIIHPADRETVLSTVRAAAEAHREFETEWRIALTDSSAPRWLMSRGRPIVERDGSVGRYIGIVIDITERKRALEELESSRRLLEQRVEERTALLQNANRVLAEQKEAVADLYNHAPCGYHSLDASGQVVAINDTELGWLGYSRAEVLANPSFANFLEPAQRPAFERNFQQFRETGQVTGLEFDLLRKDGSTLPVLLNASAVRDPAGQMLYSRTTLFDMSERKRAEDQLRIAAIAFDMRDGMIVTDAQGRILQANRAFATITGYPAEELIGHTPALLRSGRHDGAFYRTMWEAILREGHWQGMVWNRRKDGSIFSQWLSVSAIRGEDERITHYVGEYSGVSEPREAERRLLELAYYDPLTGLPNRRLLIDRLRQALAASSRHEKYGALLLIDADHFKTINDTRGHQAGDAILIEMARRLRQTLRQTDTAARLAADEFLVVLEGIGRDEITAAGVAEAVAGKLLATLSHPYEAPDGVTHLTVSVGIALFDRAESSTENLQKQADLALFQAKQAGRNALRFYNPAMQAAVDARVRLETGLRRALLDNELLLYYQPQVDWDGRLIGAEALVRWQPPGQKMVSPGDFIPVAEESGLILPIGQWVLATACRQIAVWAALPETRALRIAVNISAHQFRQPGFAQQVAAALGESGAEPSRLKLEVTESAVIEDMDAVISTMQAIRALGVTFSMDDFGTGYSSLANLKRLPIEQLKIDQSFVRDIPGDKDDCAIARAVVAMGQSLHLHVIAEGVETEAQRDFLASHGCLAYQGYLFGRPGPAEAIAALALARA